MKITVINNQDDWMAAYINGVKVEEGHRIDWDKVFKAAGIDFEERNVPPCEENESYQGKYFPQILTED